jgi:RimJ/RimL family protein N-acetyltransferase
LTGRQVTLRPPVADDSEALYGPTHGDPIKEAVWRYMGYGPWPDEGAFRQWVADRPASSDPVWFTVISNQTTQPIGMTTMLNYDPLHRRVELGHIWYIPQAHRTAANTESTHLMLVEAFDHYRCRRVEWKCDSLNARSRRAALRLGFQFEGVFRNHMIVKGRNRDTAWFAMTDRDWPDARNQLEELLA